MHLPPQIVSALLRFDKAAQQFGTQPGNTAARHQYETARDNLERAIEKALNR